MKHVLKYYGLFFFIILINGCKKEETSVNDSNGTNTKVFGKIYCETYPAGAKIYIDSIFSGKITPSVIDSLTEGIHAVEFKKTYFSDFISAVQVRSNTIPVVRFTLKQTLNISNYFPLTVGSYWTYERTDTGHGNYIDTTNFSVANMGIASNGTLGALWLEKHDNTVDSMIVYSNGDTVRFFMYLYEGKTFSFPLSIGKTWKVSPFYYSVDTVETVITKAGTFTNCFKVKKDIRIPNTYGNPTYWIHPDAGIVKVYDYDFVEHRYQIWNLKAYYIAPK